MDEINLAPVLWSLHSGGYFLKAGRQAGMVTKDHEYLIHGVIR